MGCDARLITNASYNDILKVISDNYNIVWNDVKDENHRFMGRIAIECCNGETVEKRFIFIMKSTITEELSGGVIVEADKTFYLSLHSDDVAVDIFTTIAKKVGGYVNYNDCADVDDKYWKKYINTEKQSTVLEDIMQSCYGYNLKTDFGCNSKFVRWENNNVGVVESNGKHYRITIEEV